MNLDLKVKKNKDITQVTIGAFKAAKLKTRDRSTGNAISGGARVPQLPLADTTDGSHYGLSRPQT